MEVGLSVGNIVLDGDPTDQVMPDRQQPKCAAFQLRAEMQTSASWLTALIKESDDSDWPPFPTSISDCLPSTTDMVLNVTSSCVSDDEGCTIQVMVKAANLKAHQAVK